MEEGSIIGSSRAGIHINFGICGRAGHEHRSDVVPALLKQATTDSAELAQKRAQVSVTLQVDEPGECDSIRRNTLQLATLP